MTLEPFYFCESVEVATPLGERACLHAETYLLLFRALQRTT